MTILFRTFRVLRFLAPAVYFIGAIPIWWTFSRANHDGLANIGLMLYTFPIFFIGTFLFHLEFPYFPGGYLMAHAIYFAFSTVILGALLFALFWSLQRFAQPGAAGDAANCVPRV